MLNPKIVTLIQMVDQVSMLSIHTGGLDIALSHPLCNDILPRAFQLDGAAASRREELKDQK